MQLDLKKLFEVGDQPVVFDYAMDMSQMEQWGEKPFCKPVAVKGKVVNRAGIVTLTYSADVLFSVSCARCLAPLEQCRHLEFTHTVVRQLNQQDDDDYVVVADGLLHLDTLVQADIVLELPTRVLCSADCKGLCPICGVNLNKKQCDCQPEEWLESCVNTFKKLIE